MRTVLLVCCGLVLVLFIGLISLGVDRGLLGDWPCVGSCKFQDAAMYQPQAGLVSVKVVVATPCHIS